MTMNRIQLQTGLSLPVKPRKRPVLVFLCLLVFVSATNYCHVARAAKDEYVYEHQGEVYRYSILQTGENYSFSFDKNPGEISEKLKAVYHVLQSVYDDSSIETKHSQAYTKERAKCFVFDSSFYTYTACFLPNEFSTNNRERFWGYVTQIPNWKWLVTRNLLPAVLAFGLYFYIGTKRKIS
ncbi:MAG: hypothetical protein Q7U98_03815 [Methylicorpusculum sp.]|uniref:hypothetical protein n=1 Tax=Methylicorpusculum sp. TaxID=2713644 RepID=UPI00271719BD|nr:hypothetical protein [Methylicorpusculum sp.]MDO8843150.1 hypothetical protein [Methylicorpusculum sp.]MDO8938264.1 hypothetical protein [Methylicorpusculum sp.]